MNGSDYTLKEQRIKEAGELLDIWRRRGVKFMSCGVAWQLNGQLTETDIMRLYELKEEIGTVLAWGRVLGIKPDGHIPAV